MGPGGIETRLGRRTTDPTELVVMANQVITYSFSDCESRQMFYQSVLCHNPFGAAGGSTRDDVFGDCVKPLRSWRSARLK